MSSDKQKKLTFPMEASIGINLVKFDYNTLMHTNIVINILT